MSERTLSLVQEVQRLRAAGLAAHTMVSLDAPLPGEDGEPGERTLLDVVADQLGVEPEQHRVAVEHEQRRIVERGWRELTAREQAVVAARFDDETLKAIGNRLGLSVESARRIEREGVEVLRRVARGERPRPAPTLRRPPGQPERRTDALVATWNALRRAAPTDRPRLERELTELRKRLSAEAGPP